MVFLKSRAIQTYLTSEVTHLTFTPSGTHFAAVIPKGSTYTSRYALTPFSTYNLAVWSATTGDRLSMPSGSSSVFATDFPIDGARLNGGFAFQPKGAADLVVACPFLHPAPVQAGNWLGALTPRLEVYDLSWRKEAKLLKMDAPFRAPVAWSPDGTVLAGWSIRDASRMATVVVTRPGKTLAGTVRKGW
ncbi:hypothetical protein VTI74DRAFT_3401 [Chaetomium olivicolor]